MRNMSLSLNSQTSNYLHHHHHNSHLPTVSRSESLQKGFKINLLNDINSNFVLWTLCIIRLMKSLHNLYYVQLLLIVFVIPSCSATLLWHESTFEIRNISNKHSMAIGVYNDSVWLLGGSGDNTELYEININTKHVTSHTNDIHFSSAGQMYCQRGAVLFASFYLTTSYIRGYNMQLQTQTHNILKFNTKNDGSSCIAANNGYLFRTGGSDSGNPVNVFYIYNFSTQQWYDGEAMLNMSRMLHSCDIVNEQLYVISGISSSGYTDSVLFTDISDPYNNAAWNAFPDTLQVARSRARSVVFEELIFIAGGGTGTAKFKSVEVINTVHGTIFIDSDLIYKKNKLSLAVIDRTLFSFGGNPTTNNAYYQYANIPSLHPTNMPTIEPTNDPTIEPIYNPTIEPTINPTISPTFEPTMDPTQIPTREPTFIPSNTPIVDPTNNPSSNPTVEPTNNPSVKPTMDPSNYTTNDSTAHPTIAPTELTTNPIKQTAAEAPPRSHPLSTTATTIKPHTNDNDEKRSSTLSIILVIGAVAVAICVLGVAIKCGYKSKLTPQENAAPKIPQQKQPDSMVALQRLRVNSESQYAQNDGDDDVSEAIEGPAMIDVNRNSSAEPTIIQPTAAVFTIPTNMGTVHFNESAEGRDGVITEGVDDATIKASNETNRKLLVQWLVHKVKLPQYYDILTQNGYDALEIVKEIQDENELKEIGIELKGHLKKLMKEIKELEHYVQ